MYYSMFSRDIIPINQSINQSISRHSTEAPVTVRLCRIRLETDLKCVDGFQRL